MERKELNCRFLIEEEANKSAIIVNMLGNTMDLIQPVLDALPEENVATIWPDSTGIYVSYSGNRDDLTVAIRALRTRGFDYLCASPKDNDMSWSAKFRHPDGAVIFLMFTSNVCMRKKIGTKMVEQDVYEIVCS